MVNLTPVCGHGGKSFSTDLVALTKSWAMTSEGVATLSGTKAAKRGPVDYRLAL